MPIMKKSSLFVVGVILVIALVTTPLIGCGSEGAGPEATESEDIYHDVIVEGAVFSARDESGQMVYNTNIFTPDTQEIFCTLWADLRVCCTEVTVTVIWLYLDEVISFWREQVSFVNLGLPLNTSLTRPEGGFSKGDYRVVLYSDIEEVISAPFTVE